MGRENARPRRQGGVSLRPPATNTIAAVTITNAPAGILQMVLNEDTFAPAFTPQLFSAGTPLSPADSATFIPGSVVVYQAAAWAASINVGDPWLYADTVPAIESPQSGLIT